MTIQVDMREIVELEKDLGVFARKALPHASRHTLTQTAYDARKRAKHRIAQVFVQRNKHFIRGVRVTPARGMNIDTQEAVVGHIDPEGKRQEFGDTLTDPVIPTQFSAGQSRRTIPRTRLTRAPHKLKRIQGPVKQKRGGSRKGALVAAVREAAARKSPSQRYAVLRTARGVGIFKVAGGKRNPRLQSVADLSKPAVRIPARPWLKPVLKGAMRESPRIYLKALQFQARRHRLFGYR